MQAERLTSVSSARDSARAAVEVQAVAAAIRECRTKYPNVRIEEDGEFVRVYYENRSDVDFQVLAHEHISKW